MRFRLRTLLILLAVLPPLLAWWGWPLASRILWPPEPLDDPFGANVADPFAADAPQWARGDYKPDPLDPFSYPPKPAEPNP